MLIDVVPRTEVPAREWNVLVDESAESHACHRYEFLEALGRWHGAEDLSFGLLDAKSRRIVALLPLQLTTSFGRLGRDSLLRSLGGLIIAAGTTGKSQHQVVELTSARVSLLAAQRGSSRVVVEPAPCVESAPVPRSTALLASSWLRPVLSFVQRLSPMAIVEGGLVGFARGTSSDLMAAQKAGIEVVEAKTEADLDNYYELHLETCRRTGAAPHPREYFRFILDEAHAGRAEMLLAKSGGVGVAGSSIAIDRGRAVYWTAANRNDMPRGAQRLLIMNHIKRLAEAGATSLEMGAVLVGDGSGKMAGLSSFKKSFGGDIFPVTGLEALGGHGPWAVARTYLRELPRYSKASAGFWLA